MNVLYLSPWFPYPLDTGFRIRVYYLLRALSRTHQVTLVTLNPKGWAQAELGPIEAICQEVVIVDKDPFRRTILRRATRFFSLRPTVAQRFPELVSVVQEHHDGRRFDVVIASSLVMAEYPLGLTDVSRVLEEHNSHTRWMKERYEAASAPLSRLRCWISWWKSAQYETSLFRSFDLVSMVSDEDAETAISLVQNGYRKVAVFPNGVDCTRLHLHCSTRASQTLIFSGALTYQANYEAVQFFLRNVYPLIKAHDPDVKLRVTGSTEGVDLARLQLNGSVVLTGFVDDVHREIANAAVSVVPILSGGGTRLKILEAMALGTPVVSTTKGAEGLDVIDGEHLLIADEPERFAAHTIELMCRPELRQRLTENARRLVEEKYDWEEIGCRFVSLVENVVAERKQAT